MAAIATTPVLSEKKEPSEDSIIDEKLSISDNEIELAPGSAPLVDLHAAALSDKWVGDVYDNDRAIDLGMDGKERPIGASSPNACVWM